MTLCSLGELLQITAPEVDRDLIPPPVWRRAAMIAAALPDVVSVAGFECRLGTEVERVDFHVCIRADSGRPRLAEWLRKVDGGFSGRREGWQPAVSFLRHWTDPTRAAYADVAAVWLKFDLHRGDDGVPPPFAIATLTRRWDRGAGWSRAREEAAVVDVVPSLSTAPGVTPETLSAVRRCVQRLPASACVAHVAVPTRGRRDRVRLILDLPWQALPAYLERIGWGAVDERLHALLRRLCDGTVLHAFHLDVGERVAPRLGSEFYCPAPPRNDPRWKAVFDHLGELGVCTAERRALVENWWAPADPRARRTLRVSRDLLVKVDYGGEEIGAKAYLPFHAYEGKDASPTT